MSKRFSGLFAAFSVAFFPFAISTPASAQQLVPRAFWPSPVGTTVAVLGYQRSEGDIVVDQSLPVTGVDSSIDYGQVSFQRAYDWWGRTGTFQISQAFADGETQGIFEEQAFTRRTVGAMDTVGRFAINLMGAPAMDRKTFSEKMRDPDPILGVSFTVVAPTGAYDKDRVLNLGTNRWSVQPAIGGIYPITPTLLLEVELGVWFFGDNDEFVGSKREQDPVGNLQFHLVKRFGNGIWAALDANYYTGGRTRIDGVRNSDLQRNSRFGGTLVFPIKRGHALRVGASTGTVTETGGDFDLFSLAYIRAF